MRHTKGFRIFSLFFSILLGAFSLAHAQTDSSGVRHIRGTPKLDSSAGVVTGAIVLPYNLKPGTYRNRAPYPLMLSMMIPNWAGNGEIWIDGRLVNRMASADSGSNAAISGIIPAGSEFSVNFDTVVIAMSATGNWAETGITFPIRSWYTASYFKTPASYFQVKDCDIYTDQYGRIFAVTIPSQSCGTVRKYTNTSHIGMISSGKYAYLPFFANTYLYSTEGSVYWRDIYSNTYTCRGSLMVENNLNSVSTQWISDLLVPNQLPSQSACTPAGVAEYHRCGVYPCPPPPPLDTP